MHKEYPDNLTNGVQSADKTSIPQKGMFDRFDRRINYLRISVTDRCNLRCTYCMPEEGVKLLNHSEILSFEEITEVVRVAVSAGVSKVRITGGEPLVRKEIVTLVKLISSIKGIRDLSMTTNGILLAQYASELKEAGLQRVNVSLDTMDPSEFKRITRGGDLQKVIDGIDAAIAAGLHPLKINCVIKTPEDNEHAKAVKEFGESRNIQVRLIRQMDLHAGHFSVVEGRIRW